MREVPEIPVMGVDLLPRRDDRNATLLRVRDRILAAADVPFAPWRDHREVRRKGSEGQLEADLVVPLAGAPMGERIGTDRTSDLHLAARDERTRHRRPEEVLAVVDGTCAKRRPNEGLYELVPKVLDVALGC